MFWLPVFRRATAFVLTASFNGPLWGVDYSLARPFFSQVLAICIIAVALYAFWGSADPEILVRLAWHGCLVAVVATGFYLAVFYGSNLRSASYPLVKVGVKGEQTACGLLVLQSDQNVIVWSVAHRNGRTIAIPMSQVTAVSLGPTHDLRKLVEAALVNDGDVMPCDEVATLNSPETQAGAVNR